MEAFSDYKNLSTDELAERAMLIATRQIFACQEFKKPRLSKLYKYWDLYDGKTAKKLRQLFNVPIPVFPGMIDTLNAQYDTPIRLKFRAGDASDYFKVEKINAAFENEIMDSTTTSKWDSKLSMARKHAIINGRAILEYRVMSDPEYSGELSTVNLKHFNFQPKGGLYLENHLFAGVEEVQKTESDLRSGAESGYYNKEQVQKLLSIGKDRNYLPQSNWQFADQLSRFKPLGLDGDTQSFVGEVVFKFVSHILQIDGTRYYICFDPWTRTWIHFDKWSETTKSELYPWVTYATHEDDENFLSKSFADDLYPAADAIVAMFNQELTNREKRNFGARAFDKDMFTDVRKLDESMHRPDALVPVDTKGGTRRIADGVFEFQVGELNGTVNLIDWISGTIGRNTGATDLSQGSTIDVSKKASVTFAEQKSVSKRVSWQAKPFQSMMADLGKLYIWGLKDHMPSTMAVRVIGEIGWDWDEITRLDLNTQKDVDVLIVSSEQEMEDSQLKSKQRAESLSALLGNPIVNQRKYAEEMLRIGGYEDHEIAEFMDVKTYSDRKSIARASESIQLILRGQKPDMWYGATVSFIQKIVDFASDRRSTLKDKFEPLMNYAMSHVDIAKQNLERKITEDSLTAQQQPMQQDQPSPMQQPQMQQPQSVNPGMPGGMSRAMQMASSV